MKKVKLFAVCCGMLLAGIVSTTKTSAQIVDPGGLSTGVICEGEEDLCMAVLKGDVLHLFTGTPTLIP
jgi:hypothetical protein